MKIRIGMSERGELVFDKEALSQHMLISGRTGMGKSKLLISIGLQMAMQGIGFCKTDLESEAVQELFALIQEFADPITKHKTILLRPSPEQTFKFDPFETDLTGKEYRAWMDRQVKQTARMIGRKQGVADYKEQPRRERWLSNVLWFVGVNVNGKHLGIHRALDVLDVGSPAWDRMFNKVAPHIPKEVERDWRALRAMSPRDKWYYTESTVNWFIQFFSSLVKDTFGGDGEPIDFRKMVREGYILLCDFGETPFFGKEQGEAFASMVLTSIMEACYFEMKQYYLIIDEADTVLGEDLSNWAARGRKRKCPLILATQHVARLSDRFTTIEEALLELPGIHISFQHKSPRDLDQLSIIHGTGELSFEKNWKPMDRPDGFNQFIVQEHSSTDGSSSGISNSSGSQDSYGNNWGDSVNDNGFGSNSNGGSNVSTSSSSNTVKRDITNSQTVTNRVIREQRYREEWYHSGLETGIDEQFWQIKQLIRNLGVAECIVSGPFGTVRVKVHHLKEPFNGLPKTRNYYVEQATKRMWAAHSFFFQPKEQKCLPSKYKKPPETES